MGRTICSKGGDIEMWVGSTVGYDKFRSNVAQAIGTLPLMEWFYHTAPVTLEMRRAVDAEVGSHEAQFPGISMFMFTHESGSAFNPEQCKLVKAVLEHAASQLPKKDDDPEDMDPEFDERLKHDILKYAAGLQYCVDHNCNAVFC